VGITGASDRLWCGRRAAFLEPSSIHPPTRGLAILDRDDDVRPKKVTSVLPSVGCFEGGSRKNDKRSIEEEVA